MLTTTAPPEIPRLHAIAEHRRTLRAGRSRQRYPGQRRRRKRALARQGRLITSGGENLMPDQADPCKRRFVHIFDEQAKIIPARADTQYHRHRKNSCDGVSIAINIGPIDRH
jgi:hypothetical protein